MASDKSLKLLSLINQMEAQESLVQHRKLQAQMQQQGLDQTGDYYKYLTEQEKRKQEALIRSQAMDAKRPEMNMYMTRLLGPSKTTGQAPDYSEFMGDAGALIEDYGGGTKDIELASKLYRDYSANTKRAADTAKVKAGDTAAVDLTPEAEDFWATQALLTGKLPSLGMGAGDTRKKLLNKASELASSMGMSPVEMRSDIVEQGSLQKAIEKNQRRLTSMGSFVRDVELTADRTQEIAERLKTTDVRLLNMPLRVVRQKVAGDADLSAYLMNLMDVAASMSKLTSGAEDSVAQLPEGAREAWQGVMDPDLPIGDLLKLLPQVKKSAKDRLLSVEQQHKIDFDKLKSIHSKYERRFGGFTEQPQVPQDTYTELNTPFSENPNPKPFDEKALEDAFSELGDKATDAAIYEWAVSNGYEL